MGTVDVVGTVDDNVDSDSDSEYCENGGGGQWILRRMVGEV